MEPLKNIVMDLVHMGLNPPPPPQMWTMFHFFTLPILAYIMREKQEWWSKKMDIGLQQKPPPMWIKSIKMFF